MSTKYMFTDTPFEERVQGLYPLIEATLTDWAAGKVPYSEFSDFMDYIRDEVEELDLDDNFCIGVWLWGWGQGKLFLPEDVPMFLEMLHPQNLYSQEIMDKWNAYWNSVDIKQRALSYLQQHPETTEEELKDILFSIPVGNALPFELLKNEPLYLELQAQKNEKYFRRLDELVQLVQTELKGKA